MAKKKRRLKKSVKFIIVIVLAFVLMLALFVMMQVRPTSPNKPGQSDLPSDSAVVSNQVSYGEEIGRGLKLLDTGNYAGIYMEDGSDEIVSNVMMVIVQNTNGTDLQYAKIVLTAEDGNDYVFTVSNLPAGAKVVLLEQNRQPMPEGKVTAVVENVAMFDTPMSLCADRILITGLDGAMNVRNISNSDISGDIYVYYKYSASDLFYGGITFRVKVEGGLKAGEVRQIMTNHFSASGSVVTMVTCGE